MYFLTAAHTDVGIKKKVNQDSFCLKVASYKSEHVAFSRPGIVVVDEQQRFGVNQRARLADKNGHYHLLVMSATPIPRSLALVLYGDLDISRIDEMPPGRQRVDTYVVDGSYHERVNAFIRRIVENK